MASSSGCRGLSQRRGSPVRVMSPDPRAATPMRNRMAVPLFPRKSLPAGVLDAPARSRDDHVPVRGHDPGTQKPQGLHQVMRILRDERVSQDRLPVGKRRDDERPLGVALGAGDLQLGIDALKRPDFDYVSHRLSVVVFVRSIPASHPPL